MPLETGGKDLARAGCAPGPRGGARAELRAAWRGVCARSGGPRRFATACRRGGPEGLVAQRGLSCRRSGAASPSEQLPAWPSSRPEAGGTPQAPAPRRPRPHGSSAGSLTGLSRPPRTASVLRGRSLLRPDTRFRRPLEAFLPSPSLLFPPLHTALG